MDPRLLNHYNTELRHLREMAGEFAREFPKIASRLALDRDAKEVCPDPYVERLLEGFAFLAARVHLKLDAEFPRFTQSLLETIYPQYLAPTPSMAVVRFDPDDQDTSLAAGPVIPRGTLLRSQLARGDRTACTFQTAHEVKLFPVQLTEARYYTRDTSELGVTAKAAIRLRLQATAGLTFKQINLDSLRLFLRGAAEDSRPALLYEQIFARPTGLVVQWGAKPQRQQVSVPATCIQRVGFRPEEAMLPPVAGGFEGYRLLREYYAFPQRFLFADLTGLRDAVKACPGNELDVIILLREPELRLEGQVDAKCFELFCSPVINLFAKQLDRISLSDRFAEFHVVPDKTRPLDFEVFDIEGVTGYGVRAGEEQVFQPFYRAKDTDLTSAAFYTANRVKRLLTQKEKQFARSVPYAGTELYVSLVDAKAVPYRTDLRELGLRALCTNRHLPLQMAVGVGRTDFTLEISAPVTAVRCLSGPTHPIPSFAEGDTAWRIISHLSLNYLSLLDARAEGATALREMLKLYVDPANQAMQRQIEGLRSVHAVPVVRRVDAPGPIAFARGLQITVEFDEQAFEGTGAILLGGVLEQFFARYVSINSFTETIIKSQQRGEIVRWPPHLGTRQIL